jgi:hypothetical protein
VVVKCKDLVECLLGGYLYVPYCVGFDDLTLVLRETRVLECSAVLLGLTTQCQIVRVCAV